MVTPDANIILYAYHKGAEQHAAAKKWLEQQLSGPTVFGLSWQAITAFIRISTNHRAFSSPFSNRQAVGIVEEWMEAPNVELLQPTERHWQIFKGLIIDGQATGPMIMDAHLAALAIEHDAQLATNDRDFTRFPKLKTIDPLG